MTRDPSTTSAERGGHPEPEALLSVAGLKVEFRTPLETIYAVNGLDLQIHRGETLGLLGESGSGKSVSAQAIMGLIESPPGFVVGGEIRFDGRDLASMPKGDRQQLRGRRISLIFQDAVTSLDPGMTVGRQIGEMFRIHEGASRKVARAKAIELMEKVGIPGASSRVDDYPHRFSGGMSQRIMVAAAIALDPDLLIADEPTTALDVTVQAQIMELLHDLQREKGMAMILITHDLGVIAEVCETVAVMYAGRVVEYGRMEEVFTRPAHPYTEGLMKATPHVTRKGDRLLAIPGTPPVLSRRIPGCPFAARCPLVEDRCREERPEPILLEGGRTSACHYAREVLGHE